MEISNKPFFLRCCLSVFIIFVLIVSLINPVAVVAHGSSESGEHILLRSSFDGKFSLEADNYDIFLMTNASPGDSFNGVIEAKNDTKKEVDLSLLSIRSALMDRTLIDMLELQLSVDGELIYSGGYGDIKEPVMDYITIAPRECVRIKVKVMVPGHVGNEIQGRVMSSVWIFDSKYHSDQDSSSGTSGSAGDKNNMDNSSDGAGNNDSNGSGNDGSSGGDFGSDSGEGTSNELNGSSQDTWTGGNEADKNNSVGDKLNQGSSVQSGKDFEKAPETGFNLIERMTKEQMIWSLLLLFIVVVSTILIRLYLIKRKTEKADGGERPNDECVQE